MEVTEEQCLGYQNDVMRDSQTGRMYRIEFLEPTDMAVSLADLDVVRRKRLEA
jgi:hypothetical protein